jgi:hypothetical protein
MGQPVYGSDRREWVFDQDNRDGLIDFVKCFDLLDGRRTVVSPELCLMHV